MFVLPYMILLKGKKVFNALILANSTLYRYYYFFCTYLSIRRARILFLLSILCVDILYRKYVYLILLMWKIIRCKMGIGGYMNSLVRYVLQRCVFLFHLWCSFHIHILYKWGLSVTHRSFQSGLPSILFSHNHIPFAGFCHSLFDVRSSFCSCS